MALPSPRDRQSHIKQATRGSEYWSIKWTERMRSRVILEEIFLRRNVGPAEQQENEMVREISTRN